MKDNSKINHNEISSLPSEEKTDIFLSYCHTCINEKEEGKVSVEQAAYKICDLGVKADFHENSVIETIINHACELEISRETSVGAGISLNEKWDKKSADEYKEKGWLKFKQLVMKARE